MVTSNKDLSVNVGKGVERTQLPQSHSEKDYFKNNSLKEE
jgi:hypothetical protein